MPNSKQIVYLSQAQYEELITNQSITVNGVTVTYDENDIYVTPQAEPVTDVRVNGTSIAVNGVANIPVAASDVLGAAMFNANDGLSVRSNGGAYVACSNSANIKSGAGLHRPIVPNFQHESTFYGLAKAAGHDENNSTESVGTYTSEAKGAIQQMLGVSDLIATAENSLVASKAYAIGDVFTANGKLYRATAAIAANDSIVLQNDGETVSGANAVESSIGEEFVKFTDYATATTPGIGTVNGYGIGIRNDNHSFTIVAANDNSIKNGNGWYSPIATINQHKATFYGLAKAAGDTTQAQSDNAVGTYTDDAKAAIKNMIGVNVEDVQTNGVSIVNNDIANIPIADANTFGVAKVNSSFGLQMTNNGEVLATQMAGSSEIKGGSNYYKPIVPANQHQSTFYALAKASGDTTQSASSNAVGTYTDNAKASIKSMLGIVDGSTGTVDVTGAAPTITAVENTRYVCGEVTSLNVTPAASGICIVRFTSGSTPTVLTLPSTVKFPEWFDSTALETDTIYEMCITDGVYGAVMSWAL